MDNELGEHSSSMLWITLFGGVAALGTFFLRKHFKGGQFKEHVSAKDKVVVITGANSGIGLETAKHLNMAKAKVYLLCRDDNRAQEAKIQLVTMGCDASRLIYEHCDLSSFESIKACAKNLLKAEQTIDILVNNAGIMFYPKFELTADGHEMTWQSNYLGPFLLTELLLPAIINAKSGRIINVSSKLHHDYKKKIDVSLVDSKKGYGFLAPYNASKLANVMHARALTHRLRRDGVHNVTVNSLHPGVIMSNLSRHIFLGKEPLKSILKPFAWLVTKTPRDGAQTSIFLALSKKVENISGKYFSDCSLATENPIATDDQACDDLYNASLEATGLAK